MDLTTEDILKAIQSQNKPPQLPMQPLGMPGPSAVMGMAGNAAQGIANYGQDVFQRMKRAVTQGPYSSPTGEYDPSIGTLPLELMMPGYGKAAGEVAAFGSSVSKGRIGAGALSDPQMQSTLANLMEKYKDAPNKLKTIYKEFREIHPEYTGSDATIQRIGSRIKNWGGTNLETGAKSTVPSQGNDFELGAFGGRGRLKTDSPGEAINRLQEQIPVTKQWIEQWAKDTGLTVETEKTRKTTSGNRVKKPTYYMKLEDPKNPGNVAEIRVPTDPARHAGYPNKNTAGKYYDTGVPIIDKDTGTFSRPALEDNLVNQGGRLYANREVMDEALRHKFTTAPYGQNWLTSPDAAPRITPPGQPTPPKPFKDPNQLKLLSSGYSPADILKILEQQQNGQK